MNVNFSGNYILKKVTKNIEEHPYKEWIETYSGSDFNNSVRRMRATVDRIGDFVQIFEDNHLMSAVRTAFNRAVQLEWMFWDSAYRLEQWPLSSFTLTNINIGN